MRASRGSSSGTGSVDHILHRLSIPLAQGIDLMGLLGVNGYELRSEHFDHAGTIVRLVLALIALARVAAAHAQTIAPTADALGLSPAAVRSLKEDVTKTKTPLVIATAMSTCMVLRGEQARAR